VSDLDVVFRNGTIVTAIDSYKADLGVKDGVIVAIGAISSPGAQEIDCSGMLVMPGGVDSHVHLDQPLPQGEMCDDFASGTASAAAGGTTTVISFAWQERGHSLSRVVADYREKAARGARVDYGFHLTITDPLDEVVSRELPMLVAEGERSVKVFMTYDGVRLSDENILKVLEQAARHGALVCVHAEHHDLIEWLTAKLIAAGLTAPKYHPLSKPMLVEREAVSRIVAMGEATGASLQVFHVSGEQSAQEVARAQARGLPVTAETCPHYLVLTAADLDRPGFEGAKFVFGPPARTPADQEALWRQIKAGVIDVISSDHSSFRFDGPAGKKIAGENAPFHRIPNGIPGLAARLPVTYTEGVVKGRIDIHTFVRLVATNPAKRFGLYPRKGTIAIGSDADLVVFDPNKTVTITNALMHHASDYTPFEGYRCTGYPVATFVRGRMVFDGEKVTAEPGFGQHLLRDDYLKHHGGVLAGDIA
jgi:dihydropyrimidinase